MRIFPTLLVAFFCLTGAHAQSNLPDAPAKANDAPALITATTPPATVRKTVVFHKNIFWPLVGALGTAAVFDAQMSHDYGVSHPTAVETNSAWLVGRKPSLGRYYATFAVLDGGGALISYKLLHSRRKPLRVIGWTILGGLTYIHSYDDVYQAVR